MPATQSLIPIVGNIHYDDLTNEFEARATLELKTPFGIFRKEFRATLGDLAAAIAWLTNLWTGQSLETIPDELAYPVGDLAALGAILTSGPIFASVLPTLPTPVDVPDVPDGGAWEDYVTAGGDVTHWGYTP